MKASCLWEHAGLLTFWWEKKHEDGAHVVWTVHLLPAPSFWEWSVTKVWCDGPMLDIAVGPFVRIVRHG